MNEIEITNKSDMMLGETEKANSLDIAEISDAMLEEVRKTIGNKNTIIMPITQMAVVGMGISSIAPMFRTITQTTTVDTKGLYRLVNQNLGDVLKTAKDGNCWGAFYTADGKSKFAKLKEVEAITGKTKMKLPIDMASVMMAAALFTIEQELGEIEETAKQILSFLESEKEAEVEADIETLTAIIGMYKYNWDNRQFVSSNHTLVLEIKRTARKNIQFYNKKINELMGGKMFLVAQTKVKAVLLEIQKKFQYYRLSLYTFSMASFAEIMLSGNFSEENLEAIQNEIENQSLDYRELFTVCSAYLEKMAKVSIKNCVLEGVGTASGAVGKMVKEIPIVKKSQIDRVFLENGKRIKNSAQEIGNGIVKEFAGMNNPGTYIFINKINDMIRIYNHTSEIYLDDKNIYLTAE